MSIFRKLGASFLANKAIAFLESRGWSRDKDDRAKVRSFFQALALNSLDLESGKDADDVPTAWNRESQKRKSLKKLAKKSPIP